MENQSEELLLYRFILRAIFLSELGKGRSLKRAVRAPETIQSSRPAFLSGDTAAFLRSQK